jgi:hypothetical protein
MTYRVNGEGSLLTRAETLALEIPPHDADAELGLLAAEIYGPGTFSEFGVTRADFYTGIGREIFDALEALRLARAPISFDTLRHCLKALPDDVWETIGGEGTISAIESVTSAATCAEYYFDLVRSAAVRRAVRERALALAGAAGAPNASLTTLFERADFSDLETAPQGLQTFRRLAELNPKLRDPLIDGLLRRGEVGNIIAPSKIGKSWLSYGLALSVSVGSEWLGFRTTAGRVLLIDNELHESTIVYRVQAVADAMGIRFEEYADSLTVWAMRGKSEDVFSIGRKVRPLRDRFVLAIIDAKYRSLPAGTSENDNAAEAAFYNEVDSWGLAVVPVHHSTKGLQSDRRVTDVGAGGGAQSRAADCHIALREHQQPGVFVLEAAVRSFAPVEPIGLQWQFPLWIPDSEVDPERLKRQPTRQDENQAANDAEADRAVLDACPTWRTRGEIRLAVPFGHGRTDRAIARLLKVKFLEQSTEDRRNNPDSTVFRRSICAG